MSNDKRQSRPMAAVPPKEFTTALVPTSAVEMHHESTPVFGTPIELFDWRLKQVEDRSRETSSKIEQLDTQNNARFDRVDARVDRVETKIDTVNENMLEMATQTAKTAAITSRIEIMLDRQAEVQTAQQIASTEVQAAQQRQVIETQTVERTTTIEVQGVRARTAVEDAADAKKTRRAFALKVLAILGTIATAITTAIAAGRC